MKATIKTILLVTLMFATLIGYATDHTNEDKLKANKTAKVEFNNVKKGQTLNIKNDEGVIVYNSQIKNSGNYSKTFDFSALEDGIYAAELNKDFEIIIKHFYVKNGLVTFLNNKNEKVFKPVIRKEGNLVYISKIAFNNKPLNVVIYYKNEQILSETVKGEKILRRIYKLSENEVGNYKVIINTDDRSYVKNITL